MGGTRRNGNEDDDEDNDYNSSRLLRLALTEGSARILFHSPMKPMKNIIVSILQIRKIMNNLPDQKVLKW